MAEYLPANAASARFGGEEFIVYLPGSTLDEGEVVGQEICTRFAATDWRHLAIADTITASVGVALLVSTDRSIHDAISRADRALYVAKAAGRNQVCTDGQLPSLRPLAA